MQRYHVAFILAALLVLAGIGMMTWREESALRSDGDEIPEGEDQPPAAEAQPYFWPGVLSFVVGVVLAGWAYQKHRHRPRP